MYCIYCILYIIDFVFPLYGATCIAKDTHRRGAHTHARFYPLPLGGAPGFAIPSYQEDETAHMSQAAEAGVGRGVE